MRVSTRRQDTRSQEPDLKRWLDAFAQSGEVRCYRDAATCKSMDRPGWKKLEAELDGGNVSQVVVWRLDRLCRAASVLTALIEKLVSRRVGLVSLKDGFDLGTASERLLANLLASVAAFELELRAERVLAGQAAARAAGKRWGGSSISVTDEQLAAVRRLKREGHKVAAIARATGISRPTVYHILNSRAS